MTLTYSVAETSTRDQVRGRIGDTDSARELLDDSTIDAVLTAEGGNVLRAAIACCRRIIAKLARDVDRSAIGMSSSRSQAVQHYRDLITELQGELAKNALPYLGGVSISREAAIEADTDFRRPRFSIGRNDNRASATDSDEEVDR